MVENKCYCCKKDIIKDDIALCKKIIGRNTERFYCRKHLAEMLKVDEALLTEKIKQFRAEGCTLFL